LKLLWLTEHGRISGSSGAAAKLKIPRQTLESKIRRFNWDTPSLSSSDATLYNVSLLPGPNTSKCKSIHYWSVLVLHVLLTARHFAERAA
jgi:hypothetical protein